MTRFEAWAHGVGDPISEDDLEAFLLWWTETVDPRVKRAADGLPVEPTRIRHRGCHDLVEKFGLVSCG